MAQIHCPHCGQTYELTPEQVPQYAGQTINCTSCKRAFTVPREQGPGPGAGAAGFAAPGAPAQQTPYPQPQAQQPYHAPAGAPPHYPGAGGYGAGGYGGGGGGYQPPPQQRTSGLAIASLVFGIIGIVIPILIPSLIGIIGIVIPILIPSLIGIILGIVALTRTKDPRVGGKGLAIGGIAVSVASIFLAGCMLSILLPSLNRARETANRVKCASNLRQIGQALLLYGNENRGQFPPDLAPLLTTQDITADRFVCPATSHTPAPGGTAQQQAAVLQQHCSYVYVPGGSVSSAADTVLVYEPTSDHRGDGANFLFGDGHVAWEAKPTADAMIKSLEAGQNPPTRRR